jgi:IS30 family transposase
MISFRRKWTDWRNWLRGKVLSPEEREEISRCIASGLGVRATARLLDRDASVISRELSRNGGLAAYRAKCAQARADELVKRPKPFKLFACRRLHDEVNAGLARDWSPQQISKRLVVDHPGDLELRVSHETIYESLYLQARGELRTELRLALRKGRYYRMPRGSTRTKTARIAGMVNISERPAEAADRAVPGHWEGDLIIGAGGQSQVATLVERTTRFVMILRVPHDRTADRVALILSGAMGELPEALRRSLTWDQGVEMAAHNKFSIATDIPVYFCDPHSPWQRGSNENTNGLIRQYLPKGTDLSPYYKVDLDAISDRLNGRPRKTLGWRTPAEKLEELLRNAGVALTD